MTEAVKKTRHILLIMVDGLGLPPTGLAGSIYAPFPHLMSLLRDHAVPIDATLGVPGVPQSATGQTAILTGVNAARMVGGHQAGFPDSQLREIIREDNLFLKVLKQERTCLFANAYARPAEMKLPRALQSVTTVATLSAFATTLNRDDLLRGQAVYHDLTREWLREHGATDIPQITEAEAARHLLALMRTVDFCLFEYFLTDHVAHRGTLSEQQAVLGSLDRFAGALLAGLDEQRDLLLLVSDHGNIEEPAQRQHTCNPVPWVAVGAGAGTALPGMTSILQVTPRVLELVCGGGC